MQAVSRVEAEHYAWGSDSDGWHLLRDPRLSVIEEKMPPGACEVMHFHRHAQQFFYVLAGTALFHVNGEEIRVQPNQGLHIPAGTLHRVVNVSTGFLEFIVISQPPSHGDRVVIPG